MPLVGMYEGEYQHMKDEIARLTAEVGRLRKDRDRFQAYVHAVSPVLDPAALGKSAEEFGQTAQWLSDRSDALAAANERAEMLEQELKEERAAHARTIEELRR